MSQSQHAQIRLSDRQSDKAALLWNGLISAMLAGGVILALYGPWGELAPGWYWLAAAAVVGWGFALAGDMLHRRRSAAWYVQLLPWAAAILLAGPYAVWQGFLTWINCILSRWNSLHQSALLLFQTQASVRSVLAVSLLAAFCAGQLSYRLAARRRVVLCGICGAVLLLLQLAADTVSAWSCALYFGAFLGLWMFGKEASPLPQARRLWIGCMAVLCLCAAITPFCLCNMGSCWPSLYESQWQCQITKPFVSRFFVEYCAVNRPKRRQVMSAEA